ncbi:hypothetical protein DIPPA_31833 [Diplonema papillatum]|nr:hypothetical protein DIPPA_31833 [Diplonema papillatum]
MMRGYGTVSASRYSGNSGSSLHGVTAGRKAGPCPEVRGVVVWDITAWGGMEWDVTAWGVTAGRLGGGGIGSGGKPASDRVTGAPKEAAAAPAEPLAPRPGLGSGRRRADPPSAPGGPSPLPRLPSADSRRRTNSFLSSRMPVLRCSSSASRCCC